MRHSLRWKLTASYLFLVVFSLGVAAAYLAPSIAQFYRAAYTRDVLNQARMAALMLHTYQDEGATIARLDEIASRLAWRKEVYVGVRDRFGRAPETSQWAGGGTIPPEVRLALAGGVSPANVRYDPVFHETRLFAAAPIRAGGAAAGPVTAVVQVSVPDVWVTRALERVWTSLGTALLLGAIAAFLLGTWRARALSAPVAELARVAGRIAAGNLDERADVRSRDEIGALAGTFNAMTDQLRGQIVALDAERSKTEAILASMGDAVIAIDGRGGLLFQNRAAEGLLGLPPDARGRPIRELLGGGHAVARALEAAAGTGRTAAEEVVLGRRADERILGLHATPLRGPTGQVWGAVAVLRDVTDLRVAERLRRDLTANVSHELRTPLTSIKGFAETLLDGAMADAEACRRFLSIIDAEAERLMKLVDDLMALSRLESRAETMELQPVPLDDLVADAVGRMRPQAERSRITLRAPGPTGAVVLADRDRIHQVLMNLIDNAIKFTPEGGSVEIAVALGGSASGEVDRQGGAGGRRDASARVSVSDTGCGIPPDDLPRIFDRFYRVERSRSREGGGTGLGLAIAKHIVEAHGGQMHAASRVGGGSTFTFTLPLAALEPLARDYSSPR